METAMHAEVRIREARSVDLPAIGALWRELMAHHYALDPRFLVAPDAEKKYARHAHEMLRSRDARVLVAESEVSAQVVAFLMGEIQNRPPIALPGRYGFISDICVTADWRHRGVGRALFGEMRQWFLARKVTAIELYVAEANPASNAFWQEMGMQPFLRLMRQDL